ncbi:hypothetical protein [Marinococcus luteus]|nr:hypothetical protein [Marinococcus luteus]MDZ5784203.1 hypothetical protein [Marinococcus luteus]
MGVIMETITLVFRQRSCLKLSVVLFLPGDFSPGGAGGAFLLLHIGE